MSRKNRRKREKRVLARADKALPLAMRYVAFTKYDHKALVRQRMNRGTFGAASEVRDVSIDGDN